MKKFLNKALMVLLVVIMALSSVPVTNIADIDFSSPFAITAEAAKKTIKFKKSKPSVYTGEKYTLKLLDKKGKTISAKKIKWTTANKKIATVDKKGVVKGIKAGKVKITATYKKKKYVATVTVKDYIKFKKSKPSVYIGEKYTLKLVDKKGKTISTDKIKWASADKKIATVSKKGVVTAKKEGKVKITATYKNVKYTATVTVKSTVTVNKTKLTFADGDTSTKKIKVTYNGNNNLRYEMISGEDLVYRYWDDDWNGRTIGFNVTPKSSKVNGTAKIKIFDIDHPASCVYINIQVGEPVASVKVYEDSTVKLVFLKAVEDKKDKQIDVYFDATNKSSEDISYGTCDYIALNGYTFNGNGIIPGISAKSTKTVVFSVDNYDKTPINLKDINFISAGMFFQGQYILNYHTIEFFNVKTDKNAKPACPAVSGKKLLYSDANIDIYFGGIKRVDGIGAGSFEGNLIVKNKTKATFIVRDNPNSVGEYGPDYLVIAGERYESYVSMLGDDFLTEMMDKLEIEANIAPNSIAHCKFIAEDDGRTVDASSIKTIDGQICVVPADDYEGHSAYRAVFGTFTTADPSIK
ncbi:MAG: Ig domain-containing protein [Clostridia bacterium]|nr:Ig domain-containing protein [Clostridia bacterium]